METQKLKGTVKGIYWKKKDGSEYTFTTKTGQTRNFARVIIEGGSGLPLKFTCWDTSVASAMKVGDYGEAEYKPSINDFPHSLVSFTKEESNMVEQPKEVQRDLVNEPMNEDPVYAMLQNIDNKLSHIMKINGWNE